MSRVHEFFHDHTHSYLTTPTKINIAKNTKMCANRLSNTIGDVLVVKSNAIEDERSDTVSTKP